MQALGPPENEAKTTGHGRIFTSCTLLDMTITNLVIDYGSDLKFTTTSTTMTQKRNCNSE